MPAIDVVAAPRFAANPNEQRALNAPQLAQRHGQAVLAQVAAEFAQHQRSRYRVLLDGGGQPQNFVPMGAYLLE